MVMNECSACPRCGGRLKYYDSVPRLVRTKGRQTSRVPMRRLRCSGCGAIHRELGGLFFPYKQYEAEVIFGAKVRSMPGQQPRKRSAKCATPCGSTTSTTRS